MGKVPLLQAMHSRFPGSTEHITSGLLDCGVGLEVFVADGHAPPERFDHTNTFLG